VCFGVAPGAEAAESREVGNLLRFDRALSAIEAGILTHRFVVEVAETDDQRQQGLMFRERMHPNAGMLFDYGTPQVVQMWMKNTYIPLDMIFIDSTGVIQHIVERTVPHSLQAISSQKRVRGVLEVNAGTVLRLGLRVGDKVIHPIFQN